MAEHAPNEHVDDEHVANEHVDDEPFMRDPQARRALDQLHDRQPNFDPDQRETFTAENGWNIDDYRQVLPSEEPGPPAPDGSWEIARGLMRKYEFADPSIVRAIYYPGDPLDERTMLLQARFYGLKFHLGVRVGGIEDTTRTVDGRDVRVWGWNYRTLQGHLEMGQMDYEVLKWLDTGEVEFRIHAFSRAAEIPNPVIRLGFRVFGRHMQVRFAKRACQRMSELTKAELGRRRQGDRGESDDLPRAQEGVTVLPVPHGHNGLGERFRRQR